MEREGQFAFSQKKHLLHQTVQLTNADNCVEMMRHKQQQQKQRVLKKKNIWDATRSGERERKRTRKKWERGRRGQRCQFAGGERG